MGNEKTEEARLRAHLVENWRRYYEAFPSERERFLLEMWQKRHASDDEETAAAGW